MQHHYYSKRSEINPENSSDKQVSVNGEQLYRVHNANRMSTDELIEAIRDKIQQVLVISSER